MPTYKILEETNFEEAKSCIFYVTMIFFSLRKVVQLVGVQRGESFKKNYHNKRGSRERKCQKKATTNTYPYWDLLDLRFLQVGVLILTLK